MAGIPKFNTVVNPSKIVGDVTRSWKEKKKDIESTIDSPELKKYANMDTLNTIKDEVVQAAKNKGEEMISGLNLENFNAESMANKADEYKQTFTDAMGRFKDVDSLDSAKNEIINLVNEKTSSMMTNIDPSNMEGTQKSIDDAMASFDDISNAINGAQVGIGLLTNPKKTAAALAAKAAKEILDSSPKVQEIKDSLFNELKEKISGLPQVQEYKEKYDAWMKSQTGVGDIPSDVQSAMDDPEKLATGNVNSKAMLEKAIRESGLAKKLISSWGGDSGPIDENS